MTTWTLSELGCLGACEQGKKPCTCQNVQDEYEPIPFAGIINLKENKEKNIDLKINLYQ